MDQVRLQLQFLQQLDQPAPAVGGLEGDRGARRQRAKDRQQLGGVVGDVAVTLLVAGLVDDGDLRALAVDVHADVDTHQGLLPRARRSPKPMAVGLSRGRGPDLHSCSSSVLMQQTAEQIASVQIASVHPARVGLMADTRVGGRMWRSEPERPMRPMHVVVLEVDAQHLLQVEASDDQQPVQALGADRADPALREGVGVGAWTGVSTTSAPSQRKTSSNARQNLASRSRSTNWTRRPRSPSTSSRLRACWATQAPSGLAVTPARWTRRVSSSMKNSTYSRRSQTVSTVKQVAGQDPGGLLAKKRPPGHARAPRGRVQAVAPQRRADGGRRDPHAKAEQLALDALVAPAGILGGQADDQLLEVLVECGAPASTMRVGPGASDQAAVPAQQRLGPDQEAGPAGPWQQAADGGQQSPVGGLEPGSWDLAPAAQHGQLVAQHQDLQVLGGVAADQQGEQLDGAAQREVGEFGEHQVASGRWDGGNRCVTLPRPPLPQTPAHTGRASISVPHGLAERSGGTFRVALHDAVANDEHAVGLHVAEGEREGRRLHSLQTVVLHVREGRITEAWAPHYDQHATDELWA